MLTGDRPTGPLHIGHYLASLRNRVRLQDKGVETFVVIADYQVITDRDSVGEIGANVRGLVLDYLAAGLDPERTTIFTHSAVPALNQLMLPFLSLVTDAELRRNPTVKDELALSDGRPLSGLLLTYPVHQAADILFCHSRIVPVGRDQLPHLALTRAVARRFNTRYAAGHSVFPEPEALLSDVPRPAVAAISSFTVGLRATSATLTRLRNGSTSWFSSATWLWAKITARAGSMPTAR